MDRVNLMQEYFCTLDEGMGTAYERYALNRFLNDLIERYKIEKVVEVPANGVMGVPGLKSMIFAMAGCEVTLVNPSEGAIEDMKTLWDALDLKADFVVADYYDTGLPANHADLVWNFCVYERFEDSAKVVAEMARISKKYVLIEIQNILNFGMPLHKAYHKLRGESWDHGTVEKMRYSDVVSDMDKANLDAIEIGATDMPPWPDINIRLKDVGKDSYGLDKDDPACHLRPAAVTKPLDQVIAGWERIKQKPELPDWMTLLKLWYLLVETPMPTKIKLLLAHHPYVIGKKREEKKDAGLRLKDKFLPGR
ncbi:MAG: methyltransferase domain-containing protein [Candidatus Altiarchaeota archaeon]